MPKYSIYITKNITQNSTFKIVTKGCQLTHITAPINKEKVKY